MTSLTPVALDIFAGLSLTSEDIMKTNPSSSMKIFGTFLRSACDSAFSVMNFNRQHVCTGDRAVLVLLEVMLTTAITINIQLVFFSDSAQRKKSSDVW